MCTLRAKKTLKRYIGLSVFEWNILIISHEGRGHREPIRSPKPGKKRVRNVDKLISGCPPIRGAERRFEFYVHIAHNYVMMNYVQYAHIIQWKKG